MPLLPAQFIPTYYFFFSSRRRHTRFKCDWSSDVCSSDLDSVRQRQSLRPILGVGGLNRGISQVGHPVSRLLIPLQFVVPVLKLLCLGVVQLIQNFAQAVESFGFIGIGLDSHFPVRGALICFSPPLRL